MPNILALLACFAPHLSATTLRQMNVIIPALITMSGRVTMRGISRWTDKGGSYRTVQRFFQTVIPWSQVFWLLFRDHILNPNDVYLLAGDETVVTKAGQASHGLDRFFSSLYGKAIPGLSFFALSLISIQQRRSYPVMVEQRVRSEAEKAAAKARKMEKRKKRVKKKTVKRKAGRRKGSKNKDKTRVELTPELRFIQAMIQKFLALIRGRLALTYLILDGHFGNNHALQMAGQCGLQLISKLRHDAALYFLYDGPYTGTGRPRLYGDKLDYARIPQAYLKQRTLTDDIQTDIYQMPVRHKSFAQPLNVVIIVKINLKTAQRSPVILFSSDLDLTADLIIDYYGLRFQIEFNFRDAKQFWGLEDFMTVSQTAVTNAANLSWLMVNISHLLLGDFRQHSPHFSVLDLKTHFRGCKYVAETLKLLPQMPDPILLQHIFDTVTALGSIHATKSHMNSS